MKPVKCTLALLLASGLLGSASLEAQQKEKKTEKENKGYSFTLEKSLPASPVKNQYRTGTCWSFATISFMESELLRTGKGEHDLSELWFARKAYELKAKKYVRMHGSITFGQGGLAMDVMHIWKHFGVLPESAYSGLTPGDTLPVHGELESVLKGYLDAVIQNRNRELSPVWMQGYTGILDAYMGAVPEAWTQDGKWISPREYADGLGLDPDDYVSIGSFLHRPFYEDYFIEIPDNWLWSSIENVSLDEMMEVLDHALDKGYTVCWDADVGEKSYAWNKGIALMPSTEIKDLSGLEQARWSELSDKDKQSLFYDFSSRKVEREITPEIRQEMFDNYQTTDDHLMHITGVARDQDGKKFYMVKNSWGTGTHIYDGYHYVSEAYMRAKTIFFMVHRDAVPQSTAEKLGL